ncbi:hypothetical protein WMF27_35145 [Sorangium sp. So ce281]|uniref:hypothetical protein n=1 Tax=unclassified Sorangium TaxID=2621164 RepID=UPI003F638829
MRSPSTCHLVEFGRVASDEQLEREFDAAPPRQGAAVEADADDGWRRGARAPWVPWFS